MPHDRLRHVTALIAKRLASQPVVALQGARQTGKSFIARKLLAHKFRELLYVTFDSITVKRAASSSPEDFLTQHAQAKPLIIDEAQKSPEIFDAIKKTVDENRIPGRYLLLGSTEFSRQTLIRESLTGRLSRVRIFPFDLAETIGLEHKRKPTLATLRSCLHKYLEYGGLPGICFLRDEKHREQLIEDWIGLICFRDLQQFKTQRLDGEIASLILREAALQAEPTLANIAKVLRMDSRRVESHLKALEELFVITRLLPHPAGGGKPIYMLFDAGVAHHFGAELERKLHIWLINEQLSYDAYFGTKRSHFFYYRSTGKRMIHLVRESADQTRTAFQIITHENIRHQDGELMRSFLSKNSRGVTRGLLLTPSLEKTILKTIPLVPWESGSRYFGGV